MRLYTGPWAYQINDRSVPASVRLRNIGAIGATRDGHEFRFGALDAFDLPASDGSTLPTPVFAHVYGGAAYWGHFVVRRAYHGGGYTTIGSIMEAYSTGHSEAYERTISKETGIGIEEHIDLWRDPHCYVKLYNIMLSMGRWEAGARSPGHPNYDAFHIVYNTNDQAVVDELYYGMVHGIREAFRDRGFKIRVTSEELTYVAPEEPQVPVEEARLGWRQVFSKLFKRK